MTTKTDHNVAHGSPYDTASPAAGPSMHLKTVALRTYGRQQSPRLTDAEITEFLPMVNSIARKVATYLKPPLSFEDMVSAGTIGLLKAARDFDAAHGAQFKTYAYIRVRGAMLDELRSASMLPSGLSRQVKEAMALSQRIATERGTAPNDAELADRLGITTEELAGLYDSARAQHFVSLDSTEGEEVPSLLGSLAAPEQGGPEAQVERAELVEKLSEAITELDGKRKQIIVLYYQQHLTMKQIADVLNITESRISQLHASALFNLSAKLREWKDGRQ
ncbi:MAG: FliA/WhiG family RNA polymerase sigma factor [Planctomycetes bacterium]|nr:FliA/WhiG family RNA polymerase sigma factor [Planctomycetota bacterium]